MLIKFVLELINPDYEKVKAISCYCKHRRGPFFILSPTLPAALSNNCLPLSAC